MASLMQSAKLLAGLVIFVAIKRWVDARKANPKGLPLPPGPKPAWLIGNVKDMPTSFEWLTYAEWGRKYGDIVHVKVFDKHIMILNTVEAMTEIFDKRSATYSDRPRLPMLNELMKWTWAFTLMHYGPMWRRSRKMFHQYFHAGAITKYQPMQTQEVRRMLLRFIETPENFMQIIRHTFASTIMQVSYGIKIQDSDDSYVDIAEKVMGSIAVAGNPGAFLVDTIPILKYVPAWFPGAGFQIKARDWAALMPIFVNRPVDEVKRNMTAGTAVPSVATSLLEQVKAAEDPELEETLAKGVLAVSYAGGADTTVSTIQTFFLTMLLYPEVQRKAQEQLDTVVGRDRLPTFDDLESLPYIQAVVKEMLRWQPVTPLAIVHRGMVDDEYGGYFIPKGSLVVGNAWAILHDERTYPDPDQFRPERFLNEDGSLNPSIQDPEIAAFGFGRRICPGRHLAINSALISIASILSTLTIEQELTSSGEPSVHEAKMSSGLLCYPLPFRCKISPRSPNVVSLVRQTLDLDE